MAEGAVVKDLRVLPSTSEPGSDGGLSVAEYAFSRGWIEPFGQRKQDHADVGRGCFQRIQWGVASLTAKGLDALSLPMLAIPDKGMDVSIDNPAVCALLIWTGVTLGVHVLGCSPPAFHLTPGAYKNRSWPSSRLGSEGESTSRAIVWAAGLQQTVQRAAPGPSW